MPNPVIDQLIIGFGTGTAGTYAISITDMSGRNIFDREQPVSDGQTVLLNRPGQAPPGNYVLTLRNLEKGTRESYKIIFR